MSEQDRPAGTREKILQNLDGWYEPARSREVEAILNGDYYDECPLKAVGFTIARFTELPTVVIGPDGKCICTTRDRCMNVDRRDGQRCTLADLKRLNSEAMARRARQSGEDW